MQGQDPTALVRLTAALGALQRVAPALAARLSEPVACDHLHRDASGRLLRDWRGTLLDLDAHGVRVASAGDPRERGLWFGLGSGRALDAALARGESYALWEPDPQLLALALARFDWSRHLASGALALHLGPDLLALAKAPPRGPHVVDVATLHMRGPEHRLFTQRGARPIALLVEGRLLVDGLAAALDRRGYDCYQVGAQHLGRAELDRVVHTLAPRFALAINDTNGLAEWTAAHDLPLAVWEIDPTTDVPRRLTGPAPRARVYSYRAAHLVGFRRAGWSHVEHLPLAADPFARRRRHLLGPQRVRYTSDVAFVGASMARQARVLLARFTTRLAELRGTDTRALAADARALERVLAAQARDLDHFHVPELLAEHMGEAIDLWRASGETERPEALVGELCASQRRAAVVAALSGHGIEVWGDEGWRELLAPFGPDGARVRYRGPAGHREEIEYVYSGATVNLDIGRLYQDDIVTLRVFDVLACGGLCLTEHNAEVERLFAVGEELETWSSLAELRRAVVRHLEHPERAAAIGARGRRAIEERHALDLRLDHMLAGLVAPRLASAA
jgi:hypothetical protein